MILNIFLLFILIYHIEHNAAESQFCSTLITKTKQDICPDPMTFDILQEYRKSSSDWKLNLPIFFNDSDTSMINEITERYNQDRYCPYIRQTNQTICCDGWFGIACDQPIESSSDFTIDRMFSVQEVYPSCHLWGQDHLRTFDGTFYRFPGSCIYKLIGSTTWQINLDYRNCSNCEKSLTITINSKTLEIVGTQIQNTTNYPSGLIIRREDSHRLDLHFTNGLRIKIDRYQGSIIVQFDPNLINDENLSGLCGDYNHQSNDDFKLFLNGQITSVPVDFGNQWKLDRNCPDVSSVLHSCSIVPEALSTAIDACRPLTNQSTLFASCSNKVNMEYFYDACLNDICSAFARDQSITRIRCQAIEAFVEECQEREIYPIQWRSETSCSKICTSPNMSYVDCVSSCPATCQNPYPSVTSCHIQTSECIPGCVCADGTVYDSFQDRCVSLEECFCQYNQVQYAAGEHVLIDCNDCRCDHGRWSCTNRTCSRTCLVLGQMNIWTFDGKQFALITPCKQILVEVNDQSNDLRIIYSNENNQLSIELLRTKVTFQQNDVLINGNIRHTLPYQTDDVIIRRASTVFFEVRDIRSSVVVHFDPLTLRLYVKLDASFVNRVRGLCGTFNYVTNDDFLTPNNVIETNLVTFANAYLASSCSIPDRQTDACFNFPANEQQARLECMTMLKHPLFSTCSSHLVDLSFFLNACTRDLCADQSTNHRDRVKCSMITALSHLCASKGIVIDWMNNDTLAQSCQTIHYGQCGSTSEAKYSECLSECHSSCTDLDLMPSSCIEQCLPGCQCRSNYFYDEHSHLCRPRQECPCYEQNSEQYIHPSHSLLIQTPIQANCSCSNGSLRCTTNTNQQCGSTQIYALNTTLCPRTCANYLSHYDCQLYGPGCTCPPRQILLDSAATQQTCVRIDQCPCQYNRQFYLENETIIQQSHGCQNCTCQKGGTWSCQKIICKKTCTSFGHSHYQTFDGFYYNFDGQCQHILAKDVKSHFRILSENVPCGMNGRVCAKNILLQYDGVMIDLVRDRPILVNNIELTNYQSQPVTFGSIHIYQTGIYTNIKTDDLLLRWDGQTYVEIEVTSDKQMAGLCGNNNDNIEDDLNSADGAAEFNVVDMAKSWQTSAQCTSNSSESINADPCADRPEHEQRRIWARNQCDLIKIKSSISNNPFELCIDRMDSNLIDKYYQACLYDACHADRGGDCESVCTVISAYASHCQSIVGTSTIKWRTADRCPMQCDSGKVYMPCGPRCPQTCFEEEDYGGCIADSGCVDGCFCPHGQVMDNQGQCVQPHQCPCEHDNRIYPQSSRIIVRNPLNQCQRECECLHGSFICEEPKNTTCTRTNCTSQEYLCRSSGECIPLTWKCDQVIDCLDGTDESEDQCQHRCANRTDIFQCNNGQCIDFLRRCDGLPDCRDGTDEMNCTYVVPCREYECPISKLCIPKSWLCDGTVDCGRNDPSDESGDCKLNQCDVTSGRYFQCRDNLNCLPIESRCDAHQDCNDGSDEANCSSCTCTSSFTCLQTCQCLDSRRVCDGILDCIDGTDESNCTISCQSGEYTCLDGKCLNRTYLCDGIRHCSKGEDETHPDCSVTTAPTTTSHRIVGKTLAVEELVRVTTPTPNISEPMCQSELILFNDIYMKKPEISVPILGSFASFNPDEKGVSFKPSTSSTPISILLKFQPNIIIEQLVRLELPRPSNVNRFQVTFLDRYRRSIGQYGMVSTESQNLFVSPLINRFVLTKTQTKKIRALKIVILDTDDDRAPERVTIRLEGCVKKKKVAPKKSCVQIDAMNPRYTTKIIRKLGGTRPFNSTFGHLLRNYGGVTYNTSQAVIDVRFRTDILSNLKEISIPDFHLRRTNVKKIIVELFDRFHHRLFRKKTERMLVKIQMKRRLSIRFLRVSIIETTDDFAPFNVTLSIKGCFYRKHRLTKPKSTKLPTPTPTTFSTPSPCYHVNVFDRTFAHRIIGQMEGTKPLSTSSFLDLIESDTNGTNYAIENPILIVRFQANVVGQLNEFSLLGHRHNVDEFRLEFFDFHHQLLYSHQSIESHSILKIPMNSMFVSSFQLTILKTTDHRPARGIRLSLIGCFSTIPTIPTISTTTPRPSPTNRTEISRPRKCHRIQLMNDSRIVKGLVTSSRLIDGELGEIYRHEVTFADRNTTIDLVFLPNLLVYLSEFSIHSNRTNLKRFRLELLNNENFVQHTIESSSLQIHLDSLPSVVIGGIRLTFLETTDRQAPKNVRLSIIGCVEEVFVPSSTATTTTTRATTTTPRPITSITPDLCTDVDAMEEPYSSQTLAGLAGTNPRGTNASLLDLLAGKSISFNRTEEKIVLFVIFKSNLFVYLKNINVMANVKRFQLDYLDENRLIIRTFHIDYSTNKTFLPPMKGIRAIRLTFEDEIVENLRLSIRGCFGIRLVSTSATIAPTISTTTSPATPCHSFDLMSNETIAKKIVAFVAGTNPFDGSIFDYFNTSKTISFNTNRPTFILVFKRNIYTELKSISIVENQTNLRRYRIDLINNDRTILKTLTIDRNNSNKQIERYPVPIYALQITFLETIDDQPVKNIRLVIDGCFGIDRSPPPNSIIDTMTTTTLPTPKLIEFTTPRCNEIELMNRIDSTIIVDSISGTLPSTKLTDYFNETALISYETNAMPIKFHLIFKRTIVAEIRSVSLIDSSTNVKRFQVDLIDDYKTIIQTIFSNENLTTIGFSEIAIAAIRIVYLETNDRKAPKNIRLSIRGCFGHLPFPRRTTTTTTVRPTTAKPKQPVKRKCSILDAMSDEYRSKILQATNNNQSVDLFSHRGLSFNLSKAILDIAFKENLIGQIENVTLFGETNNVKNFQMIFFGIDHRVLADIHFERNESIQMPIEHVNAIRFVFLETNDRRNPRGIRVSIVGCFFRLPFVKRPKTKLVEKKICREIDLFNRTYTRRIFRRYNETFLPTQTVNGTTFFIFEFRREVFIRNLRQISIRSKNHQIQQIRIELEDKHQQLLKRLDISLFDENDSNSLYSPIYPIHVRYLKISILKGKFTNDIQWSIIGCFDRMKKVKSVVKTLQYVWWTVSCVHSNILAIRHERSLMPSITGSPLPIEGHFENLLRAHRTISYEHLEKPIVINIIFPPGIIGRLYEVGIRSSNVYRIRVDLIETPNGLLYTLTSPQDNRTTKRNPNPRLTGFPPVHASALRIFLLDTIDEQPARNVKIFTKGCFYKSSVRYTTLPGLTTTTRRPKTTEKTCTYSPWTRWRQCSVTCGTGVQIRARNQLTGSNCNEALIDYRMCQLQPCTCILTKEFYIKATNRTVPTNNIIGYLKRTQEPVHIGDRLDTGTIIHTYNCSRIICLNVGLHLERAKTCQYRCVYRPWSHWSSCQGRCGNPNRSGRQYRQRIPLHILSGSHLCQTQREYRSCRTAPCFGPCRLSQWSTWSRCSKSCGLGFQRRTRFYLSVQPSCADHLEERRDCNPQCCPSTTKPTWSAWGPWSECSAGCDGGERVRYRTCRNDSSSCPQSISCSGSNRQVEPCNTGSCRIIVGSPPLCSSGKVWSDCSNACGHTCNTLTCRSCNEPAECTPGCVCPLPLVMNTFGECIELNQCLCPSPDGKGSLVSGQRVTDTNKCEDCLCSNGCLECSPSSKVCQTCPWSDWSPYGICSSKCNGTQSRYRSRSCADVPPEIEYENRTCSTNETFYQKGCSQCSCNTTTGEESCYLQCAITPEICSNLTNDPLISYEYIPPIDGQCCGSCRRINKSEICSVEELPMDFVSIDNCISNVPIVRQRCLGRCISGSICRCCSPSKITMETISMTCQGDERNSTINFSREMFYARIESCACEECR